MTGERDTAAVPIDPDNTRRIDDFRGIGNPVWRTQLQAVLVAWQEGAIGDDEFVQIGHFRGDYSASQTASRLRANADTMVPGIVDPDGLPTEVEFEWVFRADRLGDGKGSDLWVAIAAVGP